MTDLLERETVEEETEITITKEYINEDLLNRQPFIDKVKKIIELQAAQKKTACFAINGSWGVGKTFVLKKLEEQLEEEVDPDTKNEKYLIFHYNCWQYDYYEEPLVAIVSSMLDTIDEKERLISEENKAKFKGLLKAVGSALLVKANEVIEDKTGFNPKELLDIITDAGDISAEQIEELHKYDSNFMFKATLKKLQETLKELSADKTIIFVVDELDRCLPEYAIKVLERLHHIFEEVPNVQVVLSIDKGQLAHIVKTTFGADTLTEKYLSKFIRFYLDLDEGDIEESLYNFRFSFYTNHFDYLISNTTERHVNEFKDKIFIGLDMRERIEIIEKCNLAHSLINKENEKQDYSMMCIEIFLMILKNYHILERKNFRGYNTSNLFMFDKDFNVPCLSFLTQVFKDNLYEGQQIVQWHGRNLICMFNIYGVILKSFGCLINDETYGVYQNRYDKNAIEDYVKKYWEILQIIN